MQNKIVNCLMYNIKKNNKNLDDIKLEEIRYGLLGLYTMTTKMLVLILLSVLLNIFREFVMFLLFYSILRSVGFGTHAKSNLLCWISSTLLLIGIPYIFKFIELNLFTKIIIWIICFISFILFCPADTEKRPMINKKRKIKFKIYILLIDMIYLVLLIKFNSISNYIIAAMMLQAFLSSPVGYILMGQKVRFSLNDIYFTKQICSGKE